MQRVPTAAYPPTPCPSCVLTCVSQMADTPRCCCTCPSVWLINCRFSSAATKGSTTEPGSDSGSGADTSCMASAAGAASTRGCVHRAAAQAECSSSMLRKHTCGRQQAELCTTRVLTTGTLWHADTGVQHSTQGPLLHTRVARLASTHHNEAHNLLCGGAWVVCSSLHQLISADQHHLLACCTLCARPQALEPPTEACVNLEATTAAQQRTATHNRGQVSQ